MRFVEVLCEGESDAPTAREILSRRFGLKAEHEFRIHPHRGKGKLPEDSRAKPVAGREGLLDQLPAKLRGYGRSESADWTFAVIVLVDADDEDCRELKQRLVKLYRDLDRKPTNVLFRIAVEETESWFIADTKAVGTAYRKAKLRLLEKIEPDAVVGAWERLAESLGHKPHECDGGDKIAWAKQISQYLDLTSPKSPSLNAFVDGVERLLGGKP